VVTKLTIDSAGRVLIPKAMRERMHLEAGDLLEIESAPDEIILRPVRASASLQQERGVWVFRTGQRLARETVDATLGEIREERDRSNRALK
jgi:AbrB family looped-hinge helix DNA binding protein